MSYRASELILTKGRIYHLGLHPDELADIVITVGDPDRVERVSKHFDRITRKVKHREFLTHTGDLGSKTISVIGTGIGPDNIDIMMNEIDALKNIDFLTRTDKDTLTRLTIIRMGTSGAIQPDIEVDSLVASTYGMGLDGLLNFYTYEQDPFQKSFESRLKAFVPELFQICKPTIFEASKFLLNNIAFDLVQGITITAGGFYAPQGRQLRLAQKMRPIIDKLPDFRLENHRFINFEMETSSIYGLARLLKHRALSINAIIANRANGSFSKDTQKTIDRMIETVLERIEKIKDL